MSETPSSVHYINYLALDKILNAQTLVSKEKGDEAHEEMLFIIIHQTYELWFKQILHELNSAVKLFKADKIDESNIGVIVGRMDRINKIMTTLIGQVDVLETMTSLDFLDFRNYLSPASGFQSHQFRKLEVLLGLKIEKRHQPGGCPYHAQFEGDKKQEILATKTKELEDAVAYQLEISTKCTDVVTALDEIGDINGKPTTFYDTAKEAYEHRSNVENLKSSLSRTEAEADPLLINTIKGLPSVSSPFLAKNFLVSDALRPLVETISPSFKKKSVILIACVSNPPGLFLKSKM